MQCDPFSSPLSLSFYNPPLDSGQVQSLVLFLLPLICSMTCLVLGHSELPTIQRHLDAAAMNVAGWMGRGRLQVPEQRPLVALKSVLRTPEVPLSLLTGHPSWPLENKTFKICPSFIL